MIRVTLQVENHHSIKTYLDRKVPTEIVFVWLKTYKIKNNFETVVEVNPTDVFGKNHVRVTVLTALSVNLPKPTRDVFSQRFLLCIRDAAK